MCKMGSKATIDSDIVKKDRMLQINQMKESNNTSKRLHDCAEGLQEDEKALLELVSVSSEHPIGELV